MSRNRLLPTILVLLLASAVEPRAARAQDGDRGGPTPPRLAFTDGDVSFWRPGAEDWAPAQVNTPLAAGDSVYAGEGGNFEIQIGSRAFVRAGADTEVGLDSLEPDYLQFKVTGGHAALDVKRLPRGLTVEIDAPSGAFTIDRPGYYRVDADENNTTFIARRGGAATVVAAGGDTEDVGENQRVVLEGAENAQANVSAAPDPDEWDRWNYDRTGGYAEAPRSAEYIPPDVAGGDDLDRYGDWRETQQYGHVWRPREVAPDWAPYTTGRWVYDPYYEWTWVDESPWGWCPYHYGRWVNVDGFWGWAPGPVVVAPVYAPALVAFFGAPGVGVSVSVGAPLVSWVALGFGEPVVPWWGPPAIVGRPFWGGWGGPRIVNNVVVQNTTVVNVTNITKFQNVTVRNAVVGVDREHFGRGRVQHVRLDAEKAQGLRPVHGQLGVKPVAASLVAREGRGRRPPERLQARAVVATRPPHVPVERLRAKGLNVPPTAEPHVKVVKPHAGPHRGPGERGQQPAAAERPGGQPPAPPEGRRGGPGGRERPERPGRAERTGRRGMEPGETAPPPPPRGERRRPAGEERAAPPTPPGERRRPERLEQGPPGREGRPTPPPPPGARRERPGREREMEQPPREKPRPGRPEHAAPPPPQGERRRPARPEMEGRATPPSPPAMRRERPAREREAPAARPERPARQREAPAARPERAVRERPAQPAPRERPRHERPEHATPPPPQSRAPAPAREAARRPERAPAAPPARAAAPHARPAPSPPRERAARPPREAPSARRERRPRPEPQSLAPPVVRSRA
jgi:hypothetical protein